MSRIDEARRAVRVGVVVVLALVLLTVGIWVLGAESRLWSKKVEYRTTFRNVQGLSSGSTVSLAGYRIGEVSAIHLPEDISEGLVEVRVKVEKKNSRYIRKDTRARIKTIGLLGDKYIELSPGTAAEPELPPDATIEAIQPPNLESLMAQGESVADNLVVLSASLRRIVDKVDRGQGLLGALISDTPEGQRMSQDIKGVLASLKSVAQKVDEGPGLAGTLVNDPKPAADLKAVIASLTRVARNLEHGDGLAARLISDPELGKEITGNLESASRNLAELTRKLDQGEGLISRLAGDERLAEDVTTDLRNAAASIAAITRRVEEGEGTIGKLLIDETLYEGVNDILAGARKSRLTRWFLSRSQKAGAKGRLAGTPRSGASPLPASALQPQATATPTPRPSPGERGAPVLRPVGTGIPGAASPEAAGTPRTGADAGSGR